MTVDRTETSGGPSLWRALDAPAEVRHTTTPHPTVRPEHQGLYHYTVGPIPPPRPKLVLIVGGWWTTLVPTLVFSAAMTLAIPSADPLLVVAVVEVLDVAALVGLVVRR